MSLAPRKKRTLSAGELLNYALRTLGGHALSAAELRQKLEARAEQPEHVRQVLEQLRDFGYLDDRKFADAFSTARLESHGLGRQRVLSDLRRRRVAPGLAREAVDRAFAGADEVELIENYLRRKFRSAPLEEILADPKKLAAAYRRLRTAGFSAGNSIRVLKRHTGHAEALEALEQTGDEGPESSPPAD